MFFGMTKLNLGHMVKLTIVFGDDKVKFGDHSEINLNGNSRVRANFKDSSLWGL